MYYIFFNLHYVNYLWCHELNVKCIYSITFFLLHFQIILQVSAGPGELLPYFWFVFHWLAMSHSCYNPIIYCYMNTRFRSGFITVLHSVPLLRRCSCLQRCNARPRSGSNATNLAHTGEMLGRDDVLRRKTRIRIRCLCSPFPLSFYIFSSYNRTNLFLFINLLFMQIILDLFLLLEFHFNKLS